MSDQYFRLPNKVSTKDLVKTSYKVLKNLILAKNREESPLISAYLKKLNTFIKQMDASQVKEFKSLTKNLKMEIKEQEMLENIILGLISEIEDEDIEEATVTGNVQGYETPGAFSDGGAKDKKRKRKIASMFGMEVVGNIDEAKFKNIALGDEFTAGDDIIFKKISHNQAKSISKTNIKIPILKFGPNDDVTLYTEAKNITTAGKGKQPPFTILVYDKSNKLIHQEIDIKDWRSFLAYSNTLRKKYPNSKLKVEDGTGQLIYTENINEAFTLDDNVTLYTEAKNITTAGKGKQPPFTINEAFTLDDIKHITKTFKKVSPSKDPKLFTRTVINTVKELRNKSKGARKTELDKMAKEIESDYDNETYLTEASVTPMDKSKLKKIYDKLNKGDKIMVKYSSVMGSSNDQYVPFVVSKGKTVVGKSRVERITLKNPKKPSGLKYYFYNRKDNISFATGDMAATVEDIKFGSRNESMNEAKKDPHDVSRAKFDKLSRPKQLEKALNYLNKGKSKVELIKKFSKDRYGYNMTYKLKKGQYDPRDSDLVSGFFSDAQIHGAMNEAKKKKYTNRWLELKNDESMHANKKLAMGLKELKYQLAETEKFFNWYNKIKNINELDSDSFWKRTNSHIYKIKERLVNIAKTIKEIEK
jgi:hypothetical protein